MPLNAKQRAVFAKICARLDEIDPSGDNSSLFRTRFGAMSEAAFDEAMRKLRDGEWELSVQLPNFKRNADINRLIDVAEAHGIECFKQLVLTDQVTGDVVVTREPYPVLPLPIARTQQTISKKLSTAGQDRKTDALTGQKTAEDRAAALTQPEIQVLGNQGLLKTLEEFVNIRGGNMGGYAQFRAMLESTGSFSLDDVDPRSRTRVSVVMQQLLRGMHLDNNLAE